ncbi:RNA-binding domain-containing protein [Bacillus nitratireducens]|uniref:RNA-binding domain-containing protein n=1 Tax=Bacillus nitratireducens TaxID=2026193 RepID=UPI000899EE0B|nr:RNA-binding domain-containing protein [Bacillus nitratireducens]SEB14386.1 mRNA-degrading endonuclease, toxin component of the MazEF toxin-antitoxin module [Bacillus nitratireducens]
MSTTIMEKEHQPIKHKFKRGEIWLADLGEQQGVEFSGIRPVLIIQSNFGTRVSNSVIVAPISNVPKEFIRIIPSTQVCLGEHPLKKNFFSVASIEQVRILDVSRIIKKAPFRETLSITETMEVIKNAWLEVGGFKQGEDTEGEDTEIITYKQNDSLKFFEDINNEFKEVRGNPANIIKKTFSEYTVAFLNSIGGRILYGVSDDGQVKGFTASREKIDEIKQEIYNALSSIIPLVPPNHVEFHFFPLLNEHGENIPDCYLLEVIIPAAPNKLVTYYKGSEIFIRKDARNQKLLGTMVTDYIEQKYLKKLEAQKVMEKFTGSFELT